MEQLFALWEFMGWKGNLLALPLCRAVPQEHCGTRIHAHTLAPVGFPSSMSRELPSQQAAHLQRGIHRRTILISIYLFIFFLPDFGSFPALAAVPAPWEISSSDSRAAGWECFVPRSFGAVGTDVSPPMGELGRGKVLLIP